jgi:16S rRNA (uracil1498-N3)-methyltransferase
MQRFFLTDLQPAVEAVVSLAPIHSQLRRVLRVQPGTQLVILDNAGNERVVEVTSVDRRDTLARVIELRPAPAEPLVAVTLYQCVLKSDKFELVLQKATELGVTTIVPVISNRTVARPGRALEGKSTRWEAIVREAAEQAGRGGLPTIAPASTLAEVIASASGTRLLPWEEAEGSPGLLAALSKTTQPVEALSILIGPEGGFEADEVEQAKAAGWQVVTLGKRILRAETAAITVLSVATSAMGELGDAPTVKVPSARKSNEKRAEVKSAAEQKASDKKADKKSAEKASEPVVEGTGKGPTAATPAAAAGSVGSPTVPAA